jgi:hypothetical protein
MPQVQSPDTGEGLGCGRFRVYLATQRAVLESKADMQRRGQPDDGDALALTFAQPVEPAEVEEVDEEEEFGRGFTGSSNSGWMR